MPPKKKLPAKKPLKKTNPTKNADGLTAKEEFFIACYMKSFNAYRAALEAGYSDGEYAYQLLRKPKIAHKVNELKDELLARHKKEASTILGLAHLTILGNIGDLIEWDEEGQTKPTKPSKLLSWGEKYAIQSWQAKQTKYGRELKVSLRDAKQAMTLLAAYYGVTTPEPLDRLLGQLPEELSTPLRDKIVKAQEKKALKQKEYEQWLKDEEENKKIKEGLKNGAETVPAFPSTPAESEECA